MALVRRFGILILGVVVAVLGVVVFELPLPTSFGWTAYAPLPGTAFVPPTSPTPVIGAIAVVLGVCAALGLVGFRAGQRHAAVGGARRWWPFALGILLLITFAIDVVYWTQKLAFVPGKALVGTPTSYQQSALSVLTGFEYGGQVRLVLLAAGLGLLAAWVGGVLGRRRRELVSPR